MRKEIIFKFLRILVGVIIGSAILLVVLIYLFFRNICDEEIVGSYKSSDGAHEAVYTATRCGAISEDVGHISLDGKNLVNVRLGELSIEWKNNTTIYIKYSGVTAPNLIKEYKGVKIDFVKN